MAISDITSSPSRAYFSIVNRVFSVPVFAINAASAATIKTTNAIVYSIGNVMKTKAALSAQALGALGTIPAGYAARLVVFLDAAGTVSVLKSPNELVANKLRCIVPNYDPSVLVPVGSVLIANGSGSGFVIGTTALDAASITTTYADLAYAMPGEVPVIA